MFQLCLFGVLALTIPDDTPVVISLKPLALVSDRDVKLSDIAQVSAEPIRSLDVIRIHGDRTFAIIKKSELAIRLQLRGLSTEQFRLVGPEQTIVSLQSESHPDSNLKLVSRTAFPGAFPLQFATATARHQVINDATIEQAVQASLSERFDLPAADLKAQLLRPFSERDLKFVENCTRIEAIPPPELPLGRSNITLRFWTHDVLTATRSANVDVRKRQAVLVARRNVARNQTVSAADVRSEIRWLDRSQDALQLNEVASFVTRRNLRAGEVLAWEAFDRLLPAGAQSQQVIQSRDAVRITGRRKNLRFVVPAAEALQSGRVGQMIRVRNLHSNTIVLARVTAAGEVEVTLE